VPIDGQVAAATDVPAVDRSGRARATHLMVDSVMALAVIAFLALALGPHLFGYRTLTMVTDSMAPTARAGDLLLVVAQPTTAVRTGQVLTFAAPTTGSPVVTHRVLSVDRSTDRTVIRSKGDANASPDPWRAALTDDTTWRLVTVVPAVGRVLGALHQPVVQVVSVWLLPAWLCAFALRSVWRRP
jgi:signal peptidase